MLRDFKLPTLPRDPISTYMVFRGLRVGAYIDIMIIRVLNVWIEYSDDSQGHKRTMHVLCLDKEEHMLEACIEEDDIQEMQHKLKVGDLHVLDGFHVIPARENRRVVPAEVRFALRREHIIFCVPDNPGYPKFPVSAFLKTSFSAVPIEAEAVVNYRDVTGCVVHLTIPEFSSNGVLRFELIIEESRGDRATLYYSGTEVTKYLEFVGESEARLPLITTITAVTRLPITDGTGDAYVFQSSPGSRLIIASYNHHYEKIINRVRYELQATCECEGEYVDVVFDHEAVLGLVWVSTEELFSLTYEEGYQYIQDRCYVPFMAEAYVAPGTSGNPPTIRIASI
ncbi:unnamed protein product [Linum tenue]|uniref:Uncharacterized protein n=1 Tax=Linum tenue TaxID=586396 RepID=A0AAV0Q0I0_9ROSI|nr:unnamed protein product [Linum tenue]